MKHMHNTLKISQRQAMGGTAGGTTTSTPPKKLVSWHSNMVQFWYPNQISAPLID